MIFGAERAVTAISSNFGCCGDSCEGSSSALADRIAGAADGADHVGHAAVVDRLAQPPDMHVDCALVDVDRLAPDIVEQLAAREDAAGMLHHELEQAELGGAEP